MTTATKPKTKPARKLLTADDLLRLDAQGVRGELIRGALIKMAPAGHRHGKIVMKLAIRLGNFIEPRKLGTLVGSDSGVWLERDPDTVRHPRTPRGQPVDAAYAAVQAPDHQDAGGARSAPSWRYRADWLPAYAGMTEPSDLRGLGRQVMRRAPAGGGRDALLSYAPPEILA